MPIVCSSRSKRLYNFDNEEVLAEILGHLNFDGLPLAVGDRIIFEDLKTSTIVRGIGKFHTWPEPVNTSIEDLINILAGFSHESELSIRAGVVYQNIIKHSISYKKSFRETLFEPRELNEVWSKRVDLFRYCIFTFLTCCVIGIGIYEFSRNWRILPGGLMIIFGAAYLIFKIRF